MVSASRKMRVSSWPTLLEATGTRRRMGLAAREFAETLGWEAVLDDIIELYSRLAGVRPGLATSV